MKFLVVVACVVAAVSAEAPGGSGAYGAPLGGFQSQGNFGGSSFGGSSGSNFGGFSGGASSGGFGGSSSSGSSFGGFGGSSSSGSSFGGFGGSSSSGSSFGGVSGGQGGQGGQETGPKTYRYVSVHVAPEEPSTGEARQIRVPGGGNKHVNIIFVKTPSASGNQQTEVILPEQDEQKNLVYVLLKKEDAGSNIKIRRPAAQAPKKPEVYFIRYANGAAAGAAGGAGGQGGQAGGQGSQGGYQQGGQGGIGGGQGGIGGGQGGYSGGSSQGSRAPSSQYGIN